METDNISSNGPSSASSSVPTHHLQQSNSPTQTGQSHESILQDLHSYPFDTDSEFKIGLAVILGHPDTPVSEEELHSNGDLALQAKCFYYSRLVNREPIQLTNPFPLKIRFTFLYLPKKKKAGRAVGGYQDDERTNITLPKL